MRNERAEAIRKRTPLKTRLVVLFRCEWLLMNINPDRPATDEEIKKSEEWVNKMVQMTIRTFNKWETDGRPPMPVCKCEKSDPDSLGFGVPFCRNCNNIVRYDQNG